MKGIITNKYILIVLLVLSIVALGLNFVPDPPIPAPQHLSEDYNEQLFSKVKSVDDLIDELRSQINIDGNNENNLQVIEKLSYLVRYRFYHGYSYYSFRENWIAALLSKYIWVDLSAIVDPNDILQYPMAACSQQSIIVMAVLKRLHIPFRKVALKGHFALEALIDKKWYYIDVNLEPDFNKIGGRKSLNEILLQNQQFKLYEGRGFDSLHLERIFYHPRFSEKNKVSAPNALMFHKVTKFLSHWGWAFLMALFIYGLKLRKTYVPGKTVEMYEYT